MAESSSPLAWIEFDSQNDGNDIILYFTTRHYAPSQRRRIATPFADRIINIIYRVIRRVSGTINIFAAGIPGDGRCLFRSVVHGGCLRAGKPSPNESQEKELADELRATVADEFIKRRADTEWFVEGDFDTYVAKMRQPHVWGGEPELLMSSHVLQLPITVHMWDKKKNCLKIIAEYGQEYGKENPIRVLYHGYGHYDALQGPSNGLQSKPNKRW